MSSEQLLAHRRASIVECLPNDLTFLDEYQQNAWEVIVWDNSSQTTIQGLLPEAYMLRGLEEEITEITGPDRDEPGYRRIGALIMASDNEMLQPSEVTASAVKRHIKEFGDVSWYLANYLNLFYIPFRRTVPVGKLAWQLDTESQTRATEVEALEIQSHLPWMGLLGSSHLLLSAAKGMVRTVDSNIVRRKPRDERITDEQRLLVASGKFVVSMIHVLSTRFDTTYEQVLQDNRAKLEKRIREVSIFDKTGGDDR